MFLFRKENFMNPRIYCKDKKINKQLNTLIEYEWDFFQQTKNQGGPASCQEDWATFQVMRSSQFLAWNEELRESYLEDLEIAKRIGRNLITEKYGRMMEYTHPEEYKKMNSYFPHHTEQRKTITEKIVEIQVEWMEEFIKEYPALRSNIRIIHSSEDTPYDTSAETYLRGELGTYSDKTLLQYGRYIVQLKTENKNLTAMIFANIAKTYGFESIKDMAS